MIGLLLVTIAVILATEMKSLLLGESANLEAVRAIEAALVGDGRRPGHPPQDDAPRAGGAAGRGQDRASTPGDSAREVARAIDAAERRVRAAVPIARVIYLEPDIYDSAPRRLRPNRLLSG